MKIDIVYRYAWPDTAPYSLLLKEMAPWFAEAGHDVTILSGQPGYANQTKAPRTETVDGVKTRRLWLLPQSLPKAAAINMLLFCVSVFFRILFSRKPDVLWFGTTPPGIQSFLMVLAGRLKGIKTIYQVQDIHPEIAIEAGILKPSIFTRLIDRLDRYALRHCDHIVTLSLDMAAALEQKEKPKNPITIINNFAVGVGGRPVSSEEKTGPVRICYAGNIGNFQNLDRFIEAFGEINPDEAVLEMLGDGKARARLEDYCKANDLSHIRFHGSVSASKAFSYVAGCDVGLISLSPNLYRYAYPSKAQTYLAAGVRLIALVEKHSMLAQVVKQNQLGITLDWEAERADIASAVRQLVAKVKKDRGSFDVPREFWHMEHAREKWLALLNTIESNAGVDGDQKT